MSTVLVGVLAGMAGVTFAIAVQALARWIRRRAAQPRLKPDTTSSVATGGVAHGQVITRGEVAAEEGGRAVGVARDVMIRQAGLDPEDRQRLERMERIIDEIARGTAPPGTPQPDTTELAVQATEAIEERLEEALALFNGGQYREAIEGVLSAYDRELPAGARAQLHQVAGDAFHGLSDYGAAEMHYRDALRAAPSTAEEAAATAGLGRVYAGRGDLEVAEEYHRRSLAMHEEIGNRGGQASQLGNLGNVYMGRGDLDGAEEHYRKALDIAEEIGDRSGQANQLGNLGNVQSERHELESAEEYYRKALDVHEETGDRLGQAKGWGNLGVVRARRGDLEGAEERYRKALDIYERIGDRSGLANQLGNLGLVYGERGDLEGAAEHYRKALAIDEEIGNRLSQAQDLANLGVVYVRRGDPERAEEHYRSALQIAEEIRAGALVSQVQGQLEKLKATDD